MWTAPWWTLLVERIGADSGIKMRFPIVITEATDPCSPLSKAKQAKVICGNSTWSIYFVIYSDKEPNWGRFSWKPLLMELSTQGSRVEQEMALLSHSCSPLKWRWMQFLSALPTPLPKHCLGNSSMCQSGAGSLEFWGPSSLIFLSCMFLDCFQDGFRVTLSSMLLLKCHYLGLNC